VRGNAVDERGIGRSEAAGMPDRGAASLALDALQCRSNIVVARAATQSPATSRTRSAATRRTAAGNAFARTP